MTKRTFSNIKKKVAILMLVLYLISMIAAAVSTGTLNSGNTGGKGGGESSRNINHNGQRGNLNAPPIKVKANHATTTTASTAA